MNISDLVPWRDRNSGRRRNGGDSNLPLRREMDRLFDEFFRSWDTEMTRGGESGMFNPALNVAESDDAIEATVELPGLSEDDIDITLTRDGLTITGEKKSEEEERGKDYFRRERSYGYFRRTIPLPPDTVQADKVEAKFDKGVLTVTMPKRENAKAQAKRITVKSG
jgi:HSP20 family protein